MSLENRWFDLQFHDADKQHIKKPDELSLDRAKGLSSIDSQQ